MKHSKKKIIGITGGIASGKTTVAAEFEKLGCAVIDADKIAHQLLKNEKIKQKIIDLFGKKLLNTDGKIDHKKLADIVFDNPEKLKALNNLLHPVVLAQAEQLIVQYESNRAVKAIVIDMPLLIEVGWKKKCNRVIFVDCEEKKRLKRAQNKGFFEKKQLKNRENLQISLDIKRNLAENIIDNNKDFSSLKKQVAEIFSNIIVSE